MKIQIIKDDREKRDLLTNSDLIQVAAVKRLPTGDYVLMNDPRGNKGFVVEWKSSVMDLAGCITKDRFEAELNRMIEFAEPHLVLGFSMQTLLKYPHGLPIPAETKKKIRLSGGFILSRLLRLNREHPHIKVWFANDVISAQALTVALIKGYLSCSNPK